MASHLEHTYEADAGTTRTGVRQAIAGITDEDVSKSSPITAGGTEAAIVNLDPDAGTLTIRVSGHDGEWTKTSERELRRAVQRAHGVGDLIDSEGGYEG